MKGAEESGKADTETGGNTATDASQSGPAELSVSDGSGGTAEIIREWAGSEDAEEYLSKKRAGKEER